jgi:hypothetical protein
MHLVRLMAQQQGVYNVRNPLLDGCTVYKLEELEAMTGGPPEDLIMALRSLLRNIVGRYCRHWPCKRRFESDMVSEGMMAIVKLANSTVYIEDHERDIMYLASLHVRRAIERMINEMQSNAAPSFCTQEKRAREGEAPIYLSAEKELEDDDASLDSQECLYDILEVVAMLRLDYELATKVMDPSNWGLNDYELADKIGSTRSLVMHCRLRLLEQYKELMARM